MIDGETAIVILGATGGIGSALCHRLAESGARLVVAARDQARVAALASSLGAEPYVVDATQVRKSMRVSRSRRSDSAPSAASSAAWDRCS